MNISKNYKFYCEQENHISECAYSNAKIRLKCFTSLKKDVAEYVKMNSSKIKKTGNTTNFDSLLNRLNTSIKNNQLILDRVKDNVRKALKNS